jgi:hypothetical protein
VSLVRAGLGADRKSSILGVWAAEAAQTPKIVDLSRPPDQPIFGPGQVFRSSLPAVYVRAHPSGPADTASASMPLNKQLEKQMPQHPLHDQKSLARSGSLVEVSKLCEANPLDFGRQSFPRGPCLFSKLHPEHPARLLVPSYLLKMALTCTSSRSLTGISRCGCHPGMPAQRPDVHRTGRSSSWEAVRPASTKNGRRNCTGHPLLRLGDQASLTR